MTTTLRVALGLLLLAPACDPQPDSAAEGLAEVATPDAAEGPPPLAAAPPSATEHDKLARHKKHKKSLPPMPGAQAAFTELIDLLDAKHVDGPLATDAVYTAAMQGVLSSLGEMDGHEVNALLPPRDHQELMLGTKGSLVGVGVMIERVANVVVVRDVVPRGPAEKAGLQAGDRILGVDGERLESLDLPAVVDRIRGAEGSEVTLFVQRDTKEWEQPVTRSVVQLRSVEGHLLPDDVGLVRITSFAEATPTQLDETLASLREQGATRLLLDLRDCPGGLLETALQVAHRFIPPGKTLLTVQSRKDGQIVHESEGDYAWREVPMSVLIGPHTASGAEIIADAIATHDRGVLVGEATFGKHTIESIHELSGGWAVKLSVSKFATASGEDEAGIGVQPDVLVPGSPERPPALRPVDRVDPAGDPPLATALGLLRAQ